MLVLQFSKTLFEIGPPDLVEGRVAPQMLFKSMVILALSFSIPFLVTPGFKFIFSLHTVLMFLVSSLPQRPLFWFASAG